MDRLLWLIPALPLLAFLYIAFFLPRPTRVAGYVSILAILGSLVLSVLTLLQAMGAPHPEAKPGEHAIWHLEAEWPWLHVGGLDVGLGTFVDPLGAIMLVVVCAVSLLVQVYSQGYLAEELHPAPDGSNAGYSRYFAYISLFTMSMLGLVLAPNFLQLFIFWELVGLCSYLLIGFWYRKPEAASAAKKAFVVTRLGDLGFLVGILMIYAFTGSLDFDAVQRAITGGMLGGVALTVAMVLLFMGAIGKSAQFPLHVWLPDAMEGPTPVSALIHAATMVAAGVFMVARLYPMFTASPDAMAIVAWIGGITALFAATHGVVARDIKRVLAYSTVSQLGYMMMALGVGALGAGFFHLTTHAFFKALLFLGSGSVIHGSGEQDLYRMGGLARPMRTTWWTFGVGALALAGVPPLSGFWSKDEILADTLKGGHAALFVIGVVTAFLTAFYVFRAFFLAFHGESRTAHAVHAHLAAGAAGRPTDASETSHDEVRHVDPGAHVHTTTTPLAHGHHAGVHESPGVMLWPLIILAIPAALLGLAGSPLTNHWFTDFVLGEHHAVRINPTVVALSVAVALLGILLAWALYRRSEISEATEPLRALGPIYTLWSRKYYLDELYDWVAGRVVLGLGIAFDWFDRNVVDGTVNTVGWIVSGVGGLISRTQTGRVPNYALVVFAGIVVMVLALYTSPGWR